MAACASRGVPMLEREAVRLRRIVVLGAGYAGVRAVQEMGPVLDEREIVLIDRGRSHAIVTEMYRVAAGGRPARGAEVPLHRLVPHHRNLVLLQAEVKELDWRQRVVRTGQGAVAYDTVLFCLGATPEYFDIPGARESTLTLQHLDSALRLRRRLESLARLGGGRVVIVGGGLTGVELAGAISAIHPGRFRLTLAQASPSILPDEDPRLAAYAEEVLQRGDIEVRRGEHVARVTKRTVVLRSGAVLPADLVVWAGGVRGNPLAAQAGLPVDGRGRVQVLPTLEVDGHPGLFAAGDAAHVPGAAGHALPPTAQLAVQEGRAAARNIAGLLAGREPQAFRPQVLGMTAALGRGYGIARLGRLRLTGRPANALHELALVRYLYGVGGLGLLTRGGYLSWRSVPETTAERKAYDV